MLFPSGCLKYAQLCWLKKTRTPMRLIIMQEYTIICPVCCSDHTLPLQKTTKLCYQAFRCRTCQSQINERTATSLNFIEYRSEIVILVVYHYFRFKLSLDDMVELMVLLNIYLSHQAVHNQVQTFGVELGINLRMARQGKTGKKWHIDSTEIKIEG